VNSNKRKREWLAKVLWQRPYRIYAENWDPSANTMFPRCLKGFSSSRPLIRTAMFAHRSCVKLHDTREGQMPGLLIAVVSILCIRCCREGKKENYLTSLLLSAHFVLTSFHSKQLMSYEQQKYYSTDQLLCYDLNRRTDVLTLS